MRELISTVLGSFEVHQDGEGMIPNCIPGVRNEGLLPNSSLKSELCGCPRGAHDVDVRVAEP